MDQRIETLIQGLQEKGIKNPAILAAFRQIPRHFFIDITLEKYAYADTALLIACAQTISQPYVVARMTELLLAEDSLSKVLEIGTGSGYQAAILSRLVKQVYTVERIHTLYEQARQRFDALHLANIVTHYGDGYEGWSTHAPYDGIIVTAAAPQIPPALIAQLKEGARLVMPVGQPGRQALHIITRHGDSYTCDH